jgi:tRNA 5-methylaminomethyl-2-thiouridine biosynthesis bifunctional protein
MPSADNFTPVSAPDTAPRPGPGIGSPGAHWLDGVPASARFNDIYASRAGAATQARAVYVAGVGLPERWAAEHQASSHTVLELGFGLGGNFLATYAAWVKDPNRPATLDYIGIEGFPVEHAAWLSAQPNAEDCVSAVNAELCAQWPAPEPGFHLLRFAGGRVRLILVFWDVLKALAELNCGVDSVYLDGFAPAKNPDMWTPAVLAGVRRLLKPGARLASYSVAGALRANLTALGFEVTRAPGFGGKKQRLVARFGVPDTANMPAQRPRRVAIVGAGVAGLALAWQLSARGLHVTVFEQRSPGHGASGVPAALLHPPSGAHDSLEHGLQSHAFRLAMQAIAALEAAGFASGFCPLPIQELRKNGRAQRHTRGGWLAPAVLLAALQQSAAATGRFELRPNATVNTAVDSGGSAMLTVDGAVCAFDAVVLCNGLGAAPLLAGQHVALRPVAGQVELIRSPQLPALANAHCGQANVIPIQPDQWCIGNSFERGEIASQPKAAIRAQLLASAQVVTNAALTTMALEHESWVGTRVQSAERLPLIGPIRHGSRVWLNTAHASKGFITAFFAAERIAAALTGRPCALPVRLIDAFDVGGRISGA